MRSSTCRTNGELIAGLQANLLKTIQDLDLATTELKRLEPLIERGDIPGIRGIEKNYELKRLESQRLIQMQNCSCAASQPHKSSRLPRLAS